MKARSLPALAVPLLLASACASAEDDRARTALPELVTTTAPSRPSTTSIPSTTAGRRLPAGVDELAFLLEEPAVAFPVPATTTTTTITTTTSAPAATTSVTTGSGGAPVTTIAPAPPSDPAAVYRGVLGRLHPDEVVAAPVAAPPLVGPDRLPLTGLAGPVPSRPAAVVKIDNGSPARPQTGLDAADIVVEEEVEGGITRFAAIFHSTDSIVGPVRSGRTTDIGVLVSLGSPLLMYSGANAVTDALLLERSSVQNRSASRSSGYWRSRTRRAPSNLYTDTAPHWASAAGGPPPAQFAYREPGVPSPVGEPASGLTVAFRANRASWEWDGQAWLRSQGGRPHTVASGARVSAANVVVIETQRVDTGMVDSSGAPVPEFVYVGSGRATVFTDGKRIPATWTRPTLASVATLTTADGAVIELTPGRTWVELIEADAGILR